VHLYSSGQVMSVTDNASGPGAYTRVTASRADNTDGFPGVGVEIWFSPSANVGATTVTAIATDDVYAVVAWQFATPTAATVDTAMGLSNQPGTITPTAPPIATNAAGEIVVAVAAAESPVTSIGAGGEFTNDELTDGLGFAHLTDPHAPAGVHIAVWDQTYGSVYCTDAVAFAVGP
jgi:hypothetical protein